MFVFFFLFFFYILMTAVIFVSGAFPNGGRDGFGPESGSGCRSGSGKSGMSAGRQGGQSVGWQVAEASWARATSHPAHNGRGLTKTSGLCLDR